MRNVNPFFRQKNSKPIVFSAAHTLKVYAKEYPTQQRKEGKLKTIILNSVGVKIGDRNFSNNTVPDTDKNFGGSTDLAKKMARIGGFVLIPLFTPPPHQKNGGACQKF